MLCTRLAGLTLLIAATSVEALAADIDAAPSFACARHFDGVERREGLPPGLLAAIATVESGKNEASAGWPWTVDASGTGARYADKAQAMAAVRAWQAQGRRNIDVGCMQVNLMYHPTAFASLEEAFEPAANVAYAGRFLKTLWEATGSWNETIARYHSADPFLGGDYRRKVAAVWGLDLPGAPVPHPALLPPPVASIQVVHTPWGSLRIFRPSLAQGGAVTGTGKVRIIRFTPQKDH